MADNVTIPATGTGDATPVVATDDAGGAHYQRVKLTDGTADSTAAIPGDATSGLFVQEKKWSPHLVPGTVTSKSKQYTTAQTGDALWTPGSGKQICVVMIQIQCGGTTGGVCQVWFGASGDTAYNRGTDVAIFDGEFAPSATLKPGVVMCPVVPFVGTADYILRVTDDALNPLTVTVWGYEA